MTDPGERSAMIGGYFKWVQSLIPRLKKPTCQDAFEAAWQARGEYDRERTNDALEQLQELIYGSYGHDYDEDSCYEDCFVCEADLILLPALAEPAAPEEQR